MSRRAVMLVMLALFTMAIVQCAWLSDDCYITLRTVDNLFHGYGLRWNPAERVQTYTHPLWMALICAARLGTGELFYSVHVLGIATSLAAVWLLLRRAQATGAHLALGTALLLCSRSFLSYATSGLENPLTNLLSITFLLTWLHAPAGPPRDEREESRRAFWLALLACLGLLNRLDTALLFGPPLAVALWRARSRRTLALAAAAFLPLVGWELFSLVYYGFIFPNTAYAKLSTGIPSLALVAQGFRYVYSELVWDPLALVVIGLGSYVGRRRAPAVVLGMLAYLAYTVKIGGDFMAGRFFVAPEVWAVVLLLEAEPPRSWRWLWPLPLFGLVSVAWNPWFWWTGRRPEYHANGITDERVFYYHTTGLLASRPSERRSYLPNFGIERVEEGWKLIVENTIGQVGFYAGPGLHILDNYALADPLLSRLPIAEVAGGWRIGHFRRRLPAGYERTLRSGENWIADPALARFYEQLKVVTRGALWDRVRLRTILRMNLGGADGDLRDYVARGQPGAKD